MSPAASIVLAAAFVAYALLAYGYISRTPIWQNPDEPAHYNYVAFVATTGGLPVLQPGDWDSALLERVKNGSLQNVEAIRYESWQPPLFYVLAAPVFRLGNDQDVAATVTRLRAFDAVLGGAMLVLAYFVARMVLQPLLAAAVPLTMVGVPMFTSVSSSVSADPLANLLAAAILLALLTRARPLAVGVLLALGLLTKLELVVFIPLLALVFRRVRDLVSTVVIAAIATIPWLLHQVTSYGWTDPLALTRHAQVVADQQRFPGFTLEWLGQFLTISFHSFWAQFGWMAVVAPDRLYWLWGAVSLLAAVGLVIRRDWLRTANWQFLAATVVVAFVAYVGYNLDFIQFQSRYLFTALIPIAALLVRGWHGIVPRWWFTVAIALTLVALNGYVLVRVLGPGFAPPV